MGYWWVLWSQSALSDEMPCTTTSTNDPISVVPYFVGVPALNADDQRSSYSTPPKLHGYLVMEENLVMVLPITLQKITVKNNNVTLSCCNEYRSVNL